MKKKNWESRLAAHAEKIKTLLRLALIGLCGGLVFLGCTQDDGEMEWQQIESGTEAHLYGVHFVDAKHGWAVGSGGIVLKTTNGGLKWGSQSISGAVAKNTLTQVNFTTPDKL